jgi:hypothetical protein
MARRHIVITGTGRAGTSFLVQLLTKLGLPTGFSPDQLHREGQWNDIVRAGLEHDIRAENAPYVVKSPWFCDYAEEVLQRDDIIIDHVFIPVRDLYQAAESRRFAQRQAVIRLPILQRIKHALRPMAFHGGLWHTSNPAEQESILARELYKLVFALSDAMIPVTLMRFPRLARDPEYLYRKLCPVLAGIDYAHFEKVFQQTVRPEWIHQFPTSADTSKTRKAA